MSFFNQGGLDNTRRGVASSDADMSAMDDVQFSASLDALLNGDQNAMGVNTQQNSDNLGNSPGNGISPTGPMGVSGGSMQPQQPQQQQQNFMVGGRAVMPSTNDVVNINSNNRQPLGQQQGVGGTHQQQPQQQQLHGLPLASANQGPLHLTPQGAHSAAQMTLSAGHAAATGAFHPGSPAVMAQQQQQQPQGFAQAPSSQQQQVPQATYSWPITSNNLATLPQQQQQYHQNRTSIAGTASTSGISALSNPSGISSSGHGSYNGHQSSSTPSTSHTSKNSGASSAGMKRRRNSDSNAANVSEDETVHERRRQDRNQREQQRSHRITEKIAHLREVLSTANLQFKPDKYSTLATTVEYIKQLQDKSKLLDEEHRKLLDTITKTNEVVNNQYVPAYASGSEAPSVNNDLLADRPAGPQLEDESMVFVRGIDYKTAFKGCGIPMALASIDGRFLDCNNTFLDLTGYSREELLPLEQQQGATETKVSFSPAQNDEQKKNLSLFNLLSRDGMEQVFAAMSEMLKQPGNVGTTQARTESSKLADFWSGPVKLSGQNDMPVSSLKSCDLCLHPATLFRETNPLSSVLTILGQGQCHVG